MTKRDLIQPFTRALRRLVRPGDRLLVAVSGGPDSIALLDLADRAAPGLRLMLAVVHVDHGWRPESGADAELVARAAERRGLPVIVERMVGVQPSEVAGRDARLRLYARTGVAQGTAGVLLGHTAEDQGETVLTHLLRGAGAGGLAGMQTESLVSGVRLLRPLLELRRAELRAYCRARSLPFVDDPTNEDPRYLRNRVRHALLPLCEEIAPGSTAALARLAELAADERDLLAALVAEAWVDLVDRANGGLAVRRAEYRRLPTALQRVALRRVANELLGPAPELSLERVEAARQALLRGRGGAVVEWPAGARLTLVGQHGIFAKEAL